MIRILLVEDNDNVRQIVADMLLLQDDFQIAGVAANGLEALELLKGGLKTDLMIADLNMDGMDGIELTQHTTASYGYIKVLILTMHDKATYLKRAIEAGASGYLLKDGNMDELYSAIRKIWSGQVIIGAEVSS